MNNAEFVEAVNKRQLQLQELSHDDLRKAFVSVKARIDNDNIDETDVLVEVFAIVKDSCRRFSENDIVDVLYGDLDKTNTSYDFVKSYENVYPFDKVDNVGYKSTWLAAGEEIKWSIVPYDEQILAGLELYRGKIIQMATGEGKTFVAIAPTVANYVLHHHVHIMTVNDYLSKRDFELTRPIYAFLGINVACITGTNRYGYLRTKAYEADVTFGTFSDFIFDYLYDHIAESKDKQVQKDYDFVIVDEADSILIDEGVTPHIIESSDNDNQMQNLFDFYLAKVKYFLEDSVNEKLSFDVLQKSVTLKEHGKKVLTEICQMPYLFDDEYYKTGIKAIKDNPNYSTEQITAFVTEKKEESTKEDSKADSKKETKTSDKSDSKKTDKKSNTANSKNNKTADKTNGATASKNNSSTSSGNTSSITQTQQKPAEKKCHEVYHDAEGHWETVVTGQKWIQDTQDSYQDDIVCACGKHFGTDYDAYSSHADDALADGDLGHGYSVQQIVIPGTGHYEDITEQKYVIDKQAWTESVCE